MRIAYLDCFNGISGDMLLGALIDAGVPLDDLRRGLEGLKVPGWDLHAERVVRQGIAGTDVTVVSDDGRPVDAPPDAMAAGHAHPHDDHGHGHAHHHPEHAPSGGERRHGGQPTRGLAEITAILREADLPERVRELSLQAFRLLAEAEAYVHGCGVEEIHFHEVGALDCIIDIVGAVLGFELLGVEDCRASDVPTGNGFVRCAHGMMPIPAPATAELLKGVPLAPSDVKGELTTPTGAVLLRVLCSGFGPRPPMTVDTVAYGAGKKEFGDRPNLLRLVLGDSADKADAPPDVVRVLEANVDDLSPEVFPFVMERLFAAGALDVTFSPLVMKKARPATLLRVLCPVESEGELTDVIFRETSTFGLRSSEWRRRCLEREWHEVGTPWGLVRLKVGRDEQGGIVTVKPEYEDCKQVAEASGQALREVQREALVAAAAAGWVPGGPRS
ncbi:MAG TPA: nickel pincer cofactor biosynthesis protein LarC [Armatimonadota bacterium]|jgi:hypothetical protein